MISPAQKLAESLRILKRIQDQAPMATLKSPTRGRVKIPRRQNCNFNLTSENRQSFFLFHPLFFVLLLGKPIGGFLQPITFALEFQQMAMVKQPVKYC